MVLIISFVNAKSIENDNLIPTGVKDAFKNEIQRRKNEKAAEEKEEKKKKKRRRKPKKKKKGRGGIKMFKDLRKAIKADMTDTQILELPESRFCELV